MAAFILAYRGVRTSTREIPAGEILETLFERSQWFLRRPFPRLSEGDTLLFYQSGSRAMGAGFSAEADLIGLKSADASDATLLQTLGLRNFHVKLLLANPKKFARPIYLRDHAEQLAFVTNKAHWGQSIRFTPRGISQRDLAYILKQARSEPVG